MKFKEALVAWNPSTGDVAVGPYADGSGWSRGYPMTDGACCHSTRTAPTLMSKYLLFVLFNTLVVRDGIDPRKAHEAFLKIDEYRRSISPDIDGADLD